MRCEHHTSGATHALGFGFLIDADVKRDVISQEHMPVLESSRLCDRDGCGSLWSMHDKHEISQG